MKHYQQDYIAANYCPTLGDQQGWCEEKVSRYYVGMLVSFSRFFLFFYVFFSDLYLLSPVCHCWALLCGRSHPCLPDWRCLRCGQGVSWLRYISSPFLFAIECFFSSKVYLLYANFIAGTPVTSASKAWSGLRPTLRIPSWSPSTLSILSRTSAWVSWEPTVRFVWNQKHNTHQAEDTTTRTLASSLWLSTSPPCTRWPWRSSSSPPRSACTSLSAEPPSHQPLSCKFLMMKDTKTWTDHLNKDKTSCMSFKPISTVPQTGVSVCMKYSGAAFQLIRSSQG